MEERLAQGEEIGEGTSTMEDNIDLSYRDKEDESENVRCVKSHRSNRVGFFVSICTSQVVDCRKKE